MYFVSVFLSRQDSLVWCLPWLFCFGLLPHNALLAAPSTGNTLALVDSLVEEASNHYLKGFLAEGDALLLEAEALVKGRTLADGEALVKLSAIYHHRGLFRVAKRLLLSGHEIIIQAAGDRHPASLQAYYQKATLHRDAGEWYQVSSLGRWLGRGLEVVDLEHDAIAGPNVQIGMGIVLQVRGRWQEALGYFKQAANTRRLLLGNRHPLSAEAFTELANAYLRQGFYAEADSIVANVLLAFQFYPTKVYHLYGKALQISIASAIGQGNDMQAESLVNILKPFQQKYPGYEHPSYIQSLLFTGQIHQLRGNYSDAEVLFNSALALFEENWPQAKPQLARHHFLLASLQMQNGRFLQASAHFNRSLQLWQNSTLAGYPEAVMAGGQLAEAYLRLGDFQAAYTLAESLLVQHGHKFAEGHPFWASLQTTLANCEVALGLYISAQQRLAKSILKMESIGNSTVPEMVEMLIVLGKLYVKQGEFLKGREAFGHALAVQETFDSRQSLEKAKIHHEIGKLYLAQGLPERAASFLAQAWQIRKRLLAPQHPDRLDAGSSLALLYARQGQLLKAEYLFSDVLASLAANPLGTDTVKYTQTLIHLSEVYFANVSHESGFIKAAKCLEIAGKMTRELFGSNHPAYARVLLKKGLLLMEAQQEGLETAHCFQEAIAIYQQRFGNGYPELAQAQMGLAKYYVRLGDFESAGPILQEGIQAAWKQYQANSLQLSEDERKQFWDNFRENFTFFHGFVAKMPPRNEAFIGNALNLLLQTKGHQFQASLTLRRHVHASQDEAIKKLYTNWQIARKQWAYLMSLPDSGNVAMKVRQAKEGIISLEEEFYKKINMQVNYPTVTWEQVTSKLKAGEAAVEIINFGQQLPLWSSRANYLAFLLLPGQQPRLLNFPNGEEIESTLLLQFTRANDHKVGAMARRRAYKALYDKIMAPLMDELEGVEKIYLASDGVFHLISPEALLFAHAGYNTEVQMPQIIHLLSLRDIVLKENNLSEMEEKSALLLGFPDYVAGQSEEASQKQMYMATNLRPLYGSLLEVDTIGNLLKASGWEVSILTQKNATEAAIGALNKFPKVLHLATHGFYEASRDFGFAQGDLPSTNKFTASGLFLAGAGHTLQLMQLGAKTPAAEDDGFLTAYEVANMNLFQTDLVVLSACNTAIGHLEEGEGVFGLQRAFQIAGAKAVISTLWEVGDGFTALFMASFYHFWLNKQSTPSEAFYQAQAHLRQHSPDPFQWAAFRLVGQ